MSIFKGTKTAPDAGELRISYSILGIGLVTLIVLLGIVVGLDKWQNWEIALRDYISISTFGCVTIGLIYNATSLQYNSKLNKLKFEQDAQASQNNKVALTYEITAEWYKKDMAMNAEIARRFMQAYKGKLGNPRKLQEFKKVLSEEKNIKTRKALISVLNYFEHLALLLSDNVINEEILKKAFRTAFVTYYNNLKEYIEDEQKGNDGANSKIYKNFVDVSEKWQYN